MPAGERADAAVGGFGLLLGLALAEGLGGLARALKASGKVRIGWPTALLGLFDLVLLMLAAIAWIGVELSTLGGRGASPRLSAM